MKLVRLENGKNDFALINLTVGKLLAFQHCLDIANKLTEIGPVACEALKELQYMDLDNIDCFGNSHITTKPQKKLNCEGIPLDSNKGKISFER